MKTKAHLLRAGLVLGIVPSAWAQPIIIQQPQNQCNVAGTTAIFTVAATGVEPLSYQWRSYGNPTLFTNIPFGTEATLVLTNVQPPIRRFAVVVTDSGGLSATSSPLVTLTVLGITSQPTDQIVDVGATATFTVTATGTPPPAYQWRFNDVDLAGQTNRSLVLANAQSANAGNYAVIVTNACGSVTSRIASLTLSTVHRLEGITANPDHTISLSLAGVVPSLFAPYYDIYPLDASTNLVDWSPLAMLQRTNSFSDALRYLDSDASTFDHRFYRTPTNILITPLPKPSGLYPVGTVSRLVTDPGRRSFMVTFWYPAEARAGVLPAAYVEDNTSLWSYLNARNPSSVAKYVSHALPGLPVATNQTSYPVVLYSHGGGFRRQNTDKAQELASHGYVVVAPDHPWATASVLPNGQVVSGSGICFDPKACFQPTLDSGTKDLRYVLDELDRLNTNDVLLAGRLDLERVGAFGFSVGCVIVAEFCRIDARCKAGVLLDVGWALEAPADLNQLGLQKPFLSMNSTMPPRPTGPPPGYDPDWLASSLALFAKATTDAFWFQIQGSSHQSFQDRGSLINDPFLTGDPTSASRSHSQTIKACLLSFFDKYLKNQDDHLLDNPAAVYANVIHFQSK
jgi:dienelactone hydrolase